MKCTNGIHHSSLSCVMGLYALDEWRRCQLGDMYSGQDHLPFWCDRVYEENKGKNRGYTNRRRSNRPAGKCH